jgi:hypothetical protein
MRSYSRLALLCVLSTACTEPAGAPQAMNAMDMASAASAGVTGAPARGPAMSGAPAAASSAGTAAPPVVATGGTTAVGAAGAAGAAGNSAGDTAAGSGGVAAAAGASGASGTGTGTGTAGMASTEPVEVGHPKHFIASIHSSADKLIYVDVDDATKNWELDVPDGIQDFQLIGNNKLLVGYKFNFGYLEVDLATHKVDVTVRDFLTRDEAILTSVKRLPNGHTLLMAQGLAGGAKDLEVWEVDNDKQVHQKRSFKGCCGNLRVVRLTMEGHFLVGSDSSLVELDDAGTEVARVTSGGSPTYMGLKTADGSYFATNGHGGQLLAWSPDGERRVLGGRSSSSAQDVTIYQPGQFQILQNGNIVTSNWTAEDGGRGQQLVEYDPDGKMVWSWDDPMVRPQGIETLIVLDNLDPAVLNDDRDGVLKPQR